MGRPDAAGDADLRSRVKGREQGCDVGRQAVHGIVGLYTAAWLIMGAGQGKPNQNAYIESFNGRLRDECLNEHWFASLSHAKAVIEAWRREYNEERPKKSLGGMTPAAYAKQLATKAVILTTDSKAECY